MHRYNFSLSTAFLDAASQEDAIKTLITSHLKVVQSEIPVKAILLCSVTPTPNNNNQFSARAYYKDECIATTDAPSQERALRALGFGNPQAHTCKIYQRRFGDNYELRIAEAKK